MMHIQDGSHIFSKWLIEPRMDPGFWALQNPKSNVATIEYWVLTQNLGYNITILIFQYIYAL